MALTDWIISYWKLDEASGTTAFDSVGSNDGTINGATWTTGKINWGLSLDWINDNVNFWNTWAIGTWDFSWQVWAKFTTTSTKVLLSKWPNQAISPVWDYVSFITYSDWKIWFRVSDWSTLVEPKTTTAFNDWNWHHIVWVRSWTNVSLYIDWTLIQTLWSAWYNLDNTNNFTLWNFSYLNIALYFWGQSDEISIWNRALTSVEATELYNSWDGLQYPFVSGKRSWFLMKNF